jgi:hypothetical protein
VPSIFVISHHVTYHQRKQLLHEPEQVEVQNASINSSCHISWKEATIPWTRKTSGVTKGLNQLIATFVSCHESYYERAAMFLFLVDSSFLSLLAAAAWYHIVQLRFVTRYCFETFCVNMVIEPIPLLKQYKVSNGRYVCFFSSTWLKGIILWIWSVLHWTNYHLMYQKPSLFYVSVKQQSF